MAKKRCFPIFDTVSVRHIKFTNLEYRSNHF